MTAVLVDDRKLIYFFARLPEDVLAIRSQSNSANITSSARTSESVCRENENRSFSRLDSSL